MVAEIAAHEDQTAHVHVDVERWRARSSPATHPTQEALVG
jgi:hypothetical protein